MRFAHLADVHIGAWRDPRMKELPIHAFEQAVSVIIERKADFVLIAGDLFNTSLPPLDQVKRTVKQLQLLKQAAIPVYAIAGSHDYSPSGKTMLDVLEEAGLLINVMKGRVVEKGGKQSLQLTFTVDQKTGVKLTGILGRAGSLDRAYYEDLDREILEKAEGEKIFLFHAAISELKPKGMGLMESAPVSTLPKGFMYYAGGHVHITEEVSLDGYPLIVYPGPLFPASFSELEELKHSGFCFYDGKLERIPVRLKQTVAVHIDATGKDVEEANALLREVTEQDVQDTIVLLRVSGELKHGSPADLAFREVISSLYAQGAYFVMRNTAQLRTRELEEYQRPDARLEEVELSVLKDHAGRIPINGLDTEAEVALTKELLALLGEERHEGEKKYEYQERVVKAALERLERV